MYLVGTGPGAPGLLTLRGRDLLARANTVVHDERVASAHLRHVREGAEIISVGDCDRRLDQRSINDLLVQRGLQGEVVVRLHHGDPYVFACGGEEAEALAAAGVPFEVVPGVTAALASAAYAGIPMTHRGFGTSIALVKTHRADAPSGGSPGSIGSLPGQTPGALEPCAADIERGLGVPKGAGGEAIDWQALAGIDTLAFSLGASDAASIAQRLIAAGRDTQSQVALVRNATLAHQEVVETSLGELGRVAGARLAPPVTLIIGGEVGLRARLAWFEGRPLSGLTVGITRAAEQGERLGEALEDLGAETLALPTLAFRSATDEAPLHAALAALGTWHWLIFTSVQGVDFFFRALNARGGDARCLAGLRVAVVGPSTAAALRTWGVRADRVPARFVAEGLADAFEADLRGVRILLARAAVARDHLPDALAARGAEVTVVTAYETFTPPLEPRAIECLAAGALNLVTFTSASTVGRLLGQLGPDAASVLRAHTVAACIGPITAAAAQAAGLEVVVNAAEHTIDGLVAAIRVWRTRPTRPGTA